MMNVETVLEQKDLSGVDLSSASLGGCDLSGKILRGADLSNAHLGGANLRGADLRNANLSNANLGAANLTGADMRFSDMRGANMRDAILLGTDLRDAIGFQQEPVVVSTKKRKTRMEVTEEYRKAEKEGFYPLSYWGKNYAIAGGERLDEDTTAWLTLKNHIGEAIFGDRGAFSEVRLVKRHKHYSQWAYMLTKKGFEHITSKLGLNLSQK